MSLAKHTIARTLIASLPLLCLTLTRPAQAYIDLAPTLSKIISDSPNISVVEVTGYDREKHIITIAPVRALKGTLPAGAALQHQVSATAAAPVARPVAQWALPGARAVMFSSGTRALVCFGTGWYPVHTAAGAWKLDAERPDLPLAYYGTVSRLESGVEAILAGKGAVITVVAFGADSEGASFDLALNRQSLPGIVRVQRIRASASMGGQVMGASSSPAYFIGGGAVDIADLPALMVQLKSSDATARAEAADDLRTLGRKAKAAAPVLATMLKDASARVRFAAASALLQITPKDSGTVAQAIDVLDGGLADKDAAVRRAATSAAGFCGAAGAPLTEKLAGLLKDSDEIVRTSALQSISMLGPAAGKAVAAVVPLLDKPEMAIDAADALGRIGEAARPTLKRLTAMLDADQPEMRWAAVRAMAQIGGPDAHPAVDFMVKSMRNATEVEGYNMMIYFSLLGPDALDAAGTVQSFRVKNPVLPSSTLWAMAPEKGFPWQGGGGRGGGFQGGLAVLNELMYSAYVHELGDRLRPVAPILAQRIMDGTAGDVPIWGYKILAAGPDLSVGILAPKLADADMATRERAAVALGYMGESAAPAKEKVEAAIKAAATERERVLLQWCLGQMDAD